MNPEAPAELGFVKKFADEIIAFNTCKNSK